MTSADGRACGVYAAGAVRHIAARFGPALERMRTRLLDLSANNALLNYKHPKASSVRLVDEIPAQVFERLISNAAKLFSPLPPLEAQGALQPRNERTDLGDLTSATNVQNGSSLDPRERARRERREANARRDRARLAHAAPVGISASHELPSSEQGTGSRHRDLKLQTLLCAEELEEQLRKIHRGAKTFDRRDRRKSSTPDVRVRRLV